MAMRDPPPMWQTALHVSEDAELEGRIGRWLREGGGPLRLVSVTDLIDPRIAFFRGVQPAPVPPEVAARREAGRRAHERVGQALAAPEHREVRVALEGVHGRIDLLEEIPLELKWTWRLPDPSHLFETRREYLEQLGMYCAILDTPVGRLLLLEDSDPSPSRIQLLEVAFPDLPQVRSWMFSEAGKLRDALDSRDPGELRRCGWFNRSCEYRTAGICPCTGQEETRPAPVESARVRQLPPPERLVAALDRISLPTGLEDPPIGKFSELLYPRFAYFERIGAERAPGEEFVGSGLWRALRDGVLQLEPDRADDRWTLGEEPTEAIPCFRGEPYLVKTTRSPRAISVPDLPVRQPHYFLELGLRAAALGVAGGWVFLAPERPAPGAPECTVVRVRFEPLATWTELLHGRLTGLHEALRTRDPSTLPACPEWRFERCAYRSFCGDPAGRTHR